MSRFLRTLAKVGLVELDTSEERPTEQAEGLDEEQMARILAEEANSAPALPPLPDLPAGQLPTGEGLSFEELYRSAQVPNSPFPAEKLIKLLDGLRAMDPATRKAAVLAMDAADDAWTVDDALLDAERKCRALRQGVERLRTNLTRAEELSGKELASLDDFTQKAADTIRKQIAELEQLLQQELEAAAQKKAQAQADLRLARDACAREQARYEQEIARLSDVAAIFAPPAPPAAKPPTA
jgi:hypothetical protein